jgi:hypothetical protein
MAGLLGTMRTAIELAGRFHAVTDDPARAMAAARCQGVNRALEAVEDVAVAATSDQLEGLVVGISADLAACHIASS